MSYIIETTELTKFFPAPGNWLGVLFPRLSEKPVVDRVSLQVNEGELFGLLGPNGAGKTTLVKLLSTLITPSSGSARVAGFDLGQDLAIKQAIGLATSDERSFYWRLTGRQNLRFFAILQGLAYSQAEARITEVLEHVGLAEAGEQLFQTYSTGMRQRLGIARALLNRPRLLFLDEPTRSLDPQSARQLHHLLRSELIAKSGMSIFLTTHILSEAEEICDRIAVMQHGQLLGVGPVPELRQQLNFQPQVHVVVRGLRATDLEQIQQELPFISTALQPTPGQEPGTVLQFTAAADPPRLDQVIRTVHAHHGQVQSASAQQASLEMVYDTLIQSVHPTPLSPPNQPVSPPLAPRQTRKTASSSVLRSLRTAWAFIERDFREMVSYRFAFLLELFYLAFSLIVFFFLSRLFSQVSQPYLQEFGGDYFGFVLVGLAFSGVFTLGLTGFSYSLRQAQVSGTLEAMLTTSTNLPTIILSSTLWNFAWTTLKGLLMLAGGAMLGVDLSGANWGAAFLVILLTTFAFSGLGVFAASFIMVAKRGDPVSAMLSAFSTLLGGVYYPIRVLPPWLQVISHLLPVTYALEAIRKALLLDASLSSLVPEIIPLVLLGFLFVPVSLLAFRFAVRRARAEGSLAQY